MMLAEPAARRASRQHIWKALFALSVALNLFFVVGALWIRVHAPAPMASAEDRFEQMAGELGLNAAAKASICALFGNHARAIASNAQGGTAFGCSRLVGGGSSRAPIETKVMQLLDQAAQERRGYVRDLTTTTLSFLSTLSQQQRDEFIKLGPSAAAAVVPAA